MKAATTDKTEASPSVDEVLERIGAALGAKSREECLDRMQVRPETLRTWRKRGEVPLSQLRKASKLSGKPIEWFTVAGDKPLPDVFFNLSKKQVIQNVEDAAVTWSERPDSHLAAERLRATSQAIVRICAALGYEPPLVWSALIHELMFTHGLSAGGAHRIIDTLKEERKTP